MVDEDVKAPIDNAATPVCGIIMPIAAMPPKYDASHWSDVRKIFDVAIIKAGMRPQIVSDSFESDVIQQRIISNLYDNPVVVCDVSGLNPNVMFELGMRITFKQPVIIVTDDFASIPFDTKVIEHLGYPRDLHIHKTNLFIEKLSGRIRHLNEQKETGNFRSFIENFGTFDVLEPTKKVVEADQLILERLNALDNSISRILDQNNRLRHNVNYSSPSAVMRLSVNSSGETVAKAINKIRSVIPTHSIEVTSGPKGLSEISINFGSISDDDRRFFEHLVKTCFTENPEYQPYVGWL